MDQRDYDDLLGNDKMTKLLYEVHKELEWASAKFPRFNSGHEGYAVIKEELDELWAAIMNNKNTNAADRAGEALQIAAMALRYVYDLTTADEFKRLQAAQRLRGR